MYIETVRNRNSPPCILLRESYREDGKVHKRTLANLTKMPTELIDGLRGLLKGGDVTGIAEDSFDIVRTLPYGHVAATLGTLKKLGLDQLLARTPCRERDLVVAMIVCRIVNPGSKLAATRELDARTASDALGLECGLGKVSEDDLYAAMDWLLERQDRIESTLARRHLKDGTLVLYDLTSSYFEGKTCPLARRGYSRDGKKGKLQIEYGLLCDREGRPIAVEVFEGDRADPATVGSQVQKLRERFGLNRVVLVGDRGMLTEARIREDLKPEEGMDWISALRGPAIRKLLEQETIQPSLFDERDMVELHSDAFPGERLMACRNPFLAERRARKREELLAATEEKFQEVRAATERARNPLRGKDKIGLRVGKLLNRYKVGKHFSLTITDTGFAYERRQNKIREEAALDGIYVVRTSLPEESMTAEETVLAYKSLSAVENAFRSMKTVDLKVRPIYHRSEPRVRAHIFLCMLAYYVEWHMRQKLAPLLFVDDEKEEAQKLRSSVVQQAQRSDKATRKALTKETEDGLPVHSFQSLLKDLATIAINQVAPRLPKAKSFYKTTLPAYHQKMAFKLLGLRFTPACTQ